MGIESIYARNTLIEQFNTITSDREARFLALYGRRRIGKTYFVENYFEEAENTSLFFQVTGSKGARMSTQITYFMDEIREVFFESYTELQEILGDPSSWETVFRHLRMSLDRYYQQQSVNNKKIVVFIDEIPWFATQRSRFVESLEHFWNRFARKYDNFILIVCGSAASWMITHIINNTGALYDRVNHTIKMSPFTLYQAQLYLKKKKGVSFSNTSLLELYMAVGGVARYLDLVEKGQSPAEFIARHFFSKSGELRDEFDKLYASLFNHYHRHLNVVKVLLKPTTNSENKGGMSAAEILKKIPDESSGGSFQKVLNELEASDFILSIDRNTGKKPAVAYRLKDELSSFHLRFLSTPENRRKYKTSDDWLRARSTSQWASWSGVAFESICFNHLKQIIHALQIAGISSTTYSFIRRGNKNSDGCQIDLVIDRKDGVGNLVELKFSIHEYVIGKSYATNLMRKKLIWENKTKKTGLITFLTCHGLKKNSHAIETVHKELTIDALFQDIPMAY